MTSTALGAVRAAIPGDVIKPRNTDELAQLIEKALAMPTDQRAFMAKAGRDRVLKSYTVDAMCAATLDVYRKVMGEAAGS